MSGWTIIRTRRGQIRKAYGPMPEETARKVALRAAENHPGDVVIVLPPKSGVLRARDHHLEETDAA